MQWPTTTATTTVVSDYFHHYFQLIRHACHVSVAVSLKRLCGLRFTLIEDCKWANEDWVLLVLLAIEGMLLSGLVVRRFVKRRS
jgi:hypothetical protein